MRVRAPSDAAVNQPVVSSSPVCGALKSPLGFCDLQATPDQHSNSVIFSDQPLCPDLTTIAELAVVKRLPAFRLRQPVIRAVRDTCARFPWHDLPGDNYFQSDLAAERRRILRKIAKLERQLHGLPRRGRSHMPPEERMEVSRRLKQYWARRRE